MAHIFTDEAALITLALGSGRMLADSEIDFSTTKHMARTNSAPFLSYFGRLVSLNALVLIEFGRFNSGDVKGTISRD